MEDKDLLKENYIDVIEVSLEDKVPVFKVNELQLKNEKRGNYRKVWVYKSIVLKEQEKSLPLKEEYKKQKECFDQGLPFVRPIGVVVHNAHRFYAEEKQEAVNDRVILLLKEEKYDELRKLHQYYDVLVETLSSKKLMVDIKIPNVLYLKNDPTKFVLTDAHAHTQEKYPSFTCLLPNAIDHALLCDKRNKQDVPSKVNIKKYCHIFDFPCPPLGDLFIS